MGESFWPKDSLIIYIVFELYLIWCISPVANFDTHPLSQIRCPEKIYFQEFIRKKTEAMRKNVDSERLLTLQFLREEGHQRYSLRDSSTSRDAIIARNLSTKFLSRWWNQISLDFKDLSFNILKFILLQ